MAHLIDLSNQRANMAYVGEKPWHGLGDKLGQDAPLDQWRIAAGLEWEAIKRPIFYGIEEDGKKIPVEVPNKVAILRDDTQGFLGDVSDNRFHIVQPGEALEFYRDLTEKFGFKMETAGCLDDGKKIWALAKTSLETRIKGNDLLNGYLLFSTSFDGKSATRVMFTTVRVVCWNTLSYAWANDEGSNSISVPHSRIFNEADVKTQLNIYQDSWEAFEKDANLLSDTNLTEDLNHEFFKEFFGEENFTKQLARAKKSNKTQLQKIVNLAMNGKGQELPSAKSTLWGLVNGVTEYYDHEATKDKAKRMNSAYLGSGAKQKEKAFKVALDLAKQAA